MTKKERLILALCAVLAAALFLTVFALEASGRTLEELFFDVTENLSREDMSHPDAGDAGGESAAQEGEKA